MSDKRAPRRSLDDWMELVVTECRQSGLTDAAWCEAQGISPSCFYNAVSVCEKEPARYQIRLAKPALLIYIHKQDVVQIAIEPELSPQNCFKMKEAVLCTLTIHIRLRLKQRKVNNPYEQYCSAYAKKILMDALKEPLC